MNLIFSCVFPHGPSVFIGIKHRMHRNGMRRNAARMKRITDMIKKKIGIIGGGASGMAAAIAAARADGHLASEIVILEKKDRIGKKILATGNGKCNLTNLSFSIDTAEAYYHCDKPALLKRVFSHFSAQDTLDWFASMGMLTTSQNGYVYPLSKQASTVLDTLRFELERLGVCIVTECEITHIERRKDGTPGFAVHTQTDSWQFERLILSCGSPAGERPGEGRDGYAYAKALGHTVRKPLPALTALRCEGDIWKGMAGVRCDCAICLTLGEGREEVRLWERGELQLTDYGLSGIPIFQMSGQAARALENGKRLRATLDFLPEYREEGEESWKALVERKMAMGEGRTLEVLFCGLVNKKILQALMKKHGLKPQEIAGLSLRKRILRVFEDLRAFPAVVTGTNSLQNAQVCTGGVPLSQVKETLESLRCAGLFLTGELLDVDARCGGYNLQWAWSSGTLAGSSAAAGLQPFQHKRK